VANDTRCFHPSTVVFLDTEYTNLDLEWAQLWNIGMITRYPDGTQDAKEIVLTDLNLTYADPKALEIGHYWERHPDAGGDPGPGVQTLSGPGAARWVLARIRPCTAEDGTSVPVHLVGCNPIGDVTLLRDLLRHNALPWPAHYHVMCAESMAIGALRARGVDVPVPFSASWLGEQLGVDRGDPQEMHTALYDARWAMALHDAASAPM
jgi:hypothetical protein